MFYRTTKRCLSQLFIENKTTFLFRYPTKSELVLFHCPCYSLDIENVNDVKKIGQREFAKTARAEYM